MDEIIVKSQQELDNIPLDYNGRIYIEFGTPYNRAVVSRRFMYSVEARGNSSVVARGNSSVVARENSSVLAWGNSSVVAWGNSSVLARENSSVVAWENSSVVAKANSQVCDASPYNSIEISGNARIVRNPSDIRSYIEHYDIESSDGKVKLYKAVHNRNGSYVSDHDRSFEYKIGEVAEADALDTNIQEGCGNGIHVAYKAWCVDYGSGWSDLAILEVECEADGIIVPTCGSGKVRVAKVKVLREVPLEECGLLGKILAKKRKED